MLNTTDEPNVILHIANSSARTQFILQNQEYIESLPIDGMVVNIPASWNAMSPGVTITEAEVQQWLPQLADFNAGFEANYVAVFTDDPGDLRDEEAWAQVVDNWRVIAAEAKAAGFKGIIFDNEEYKGRWVDFPEDYPDASAADLAEYQALASQRGREIMQAIDEVFPEAEVGVMHGPYRSVARIEETPDAVSLQAGGPGRFELAGSFFTGLLEGIGDDQTLIDMGELYALRSQEDFAQSLDYRSQTVDDQIAQEWAVDPEALARWDEIDFAHMVYTGDYPTGFTQDPASLRETTLNALQHSENAVFVYADWQEVDLLNPAAGNADWIAALQEVRDARENGELGGGTGEPDLGDPTDPTLREGTDTDEMIVGTAEDETILGFAGVDELYGNGGRDLIAPGAGADIVGGGPGFDIVDYSTSGVGVVVNLIGRWAAGGDAEGDRLVGLEGAIGSSSSDLLVGLWETVRFDGGAGNDELYGNGGNDWLIGGAGGDIVAGGIGIDTASYVGSSAGVTIDLGRSNASGGDAEGDTLLSIENIVGSANGDVLSGNASDNVLVGGGGDDVLLGGLGSDTFVFSASGDTVVRDFEAGIDVYAFQESAATYGSVRTEVAEGGAALVWDGGSATFEGLTLAELTAIDDPVFSYGDLDPLG